VTTEPNTKPAQHYPLAYSPQGFCDATGLSRPTLYRMMRAGEIAFVKARRRTLIPASELHKLLEGTSHA
jgi:excisionase family DNA binding protein